MNVHVLRNLIIERMDLDDVLGHLADANALARTYQDYAIDIPSWLQYAQRTLMGEVKSRRRDNLEKALSLAEARMETLKPADQKRRELGEEIERLRASLA